MLHSFVSFQFTQVDIHVRLKWTLHYSIPVLIDLYHGTTILFCHHWKHCNQTEAFIGMQHHVTFISGYTRNYTKMAASWEGSMTINDYTVSTDASPCLSLPCMNNGACTTDDTCSGFTCVYNSCYFGDLCQNSKSVRGGPGSGMAKDPHMRQQWATLPRESKDATRGQSFVYSFPLPSRWAAVVRIPHRSMDGILFSTYILGISLQCLIPWSYLLVFWKALCVQEISIS